MTYNFDPDQWYENQHAMLEARFRSGGMKEEEFLERINELDTRHEEMWDRLDGTFELPGDRA
ncbi:MAG: hypothetical protein ABIK28_19360 [Planctomycetota bacterium]